MNRMTTNGPSVGRSKRTPAKHELMSKIFGREVGVMKGPRFADVQGLHWVDLTAGDGAVPEGEIIGEVKPGDPFADGWHRKCSPGILAYYAQDGRCPKRVVVDLHEKASATYESLLDNLAERLPALGYAATTESEWSARGGRVIVRVHNGDSTALVTLETPPSWAVQIVNDPNNIRDWAMHPDLMGNASRNRWCCLAMSTMGCNVGGMFRMTRAERELWRSHVQSQAVGRHPHHDLLIAAIDGDASRWGYLVTAPQVWRDDVVEGARRAFERAAGLKLRTAWLRSDRANFDDICDYLFLRNEERA